MLHRLLLAEHVDATAQRNGLWQDAPHHMGTRCIATDGDWLQTIWNVHMTRMWYKAAKAMQKAADNGNTPTLHVGFADEESAYR